MVTTWRRIQAACWRLVAGEALSPLQRMHLAFLFVAALTAAISGAFNVIVGLSSPTYALVLEGIALAVLWMWYRSRWHGDVVRMAWWFCLLAIFGIMPLNWLFNQGMSGPTSMFFLMGAAYALGVIPSCGFRRWVVLAGIVGMPPLMILLEYHHPGWVTDYPDRFSRALDLGVSYLMNVAILLILVSGHLKRVRREQRVSRRYAERLRELARRDSLTGLLNHAAFHERVAIRQGECRHDGTSAALLTYDLDHFKWLNDTHGHPYGDTVIVRFADCLNDVASDFGAVVGRCGGEEFSVLIAPATPAEMLAFDTRLREACRARPLAHGDIQFSGGGALLETDGPVSRWFERADRSLYAAKSAGRQRFSMDDSLDNECLPG
ncbi:GGDEF domain-containing protein [Modicisalibacter coralii]|uniref:GGDEF domain-containing protein n=1 Tax=Modicisalibacter coralii TaxID=2304602 RepID=UPI0013968BB9|nr:GGDEF domain-containing protein [Halomonas coralii]